jgi:hypothetical protein
MTRESRLPSKADEDELLVLDITDALVRMVLGLGAESKVLGRIEVLMMRSWDRREVTGPMAGDAGGVNASLGTSCPNGW